MGRLCLTAEETLEDLAEMGRNVFKEPLQASTSTIFSNEKLEISIKNTLERHGFDANVKMVEEPLLEGQCKVLVYNFTAMLTMSSFTIVWYLRLLLWILSLTSRSVRIAQARPPTTAQLLRL